jgi:thiamine biosynthesis lipoprotein
MATRFEIVLHGDDPMRLRAAGEEALDEIERLDAQLSLYRPASDIARINRLAANEAVRVEPGLLRLLQTARRLSEETGGAFDITVAPLLRVWGFLTGSGQLPDRAALVEAQARVGWKLVTLDETNSTVHFTHDGVMLDLGAIGKGYALERGSEILREAGVTSALLHGGTSTVCAIGAPPEEAAWKVAIDHPANQKGAPASGPAKEPTASLASDSVKGAPPCEPPLAIVELKDEALSVSAVWGKSFQVGGKTYGHVIDPRTGEPAQGAALAAVILRSAMETDALSTALLTMGLGGLKPITALRPGMKALVAAVGETETLLRVESRGIAVREEPNSA